MAYSLERSLLDKATQGDPEAMGTLARELIPHIERQLLRYPVTEEDLSPGRWPLALRGLESICAGLTLSSMRLREIRQAYKLRVSQSTRFLDKNVCNPEIQEALNRDREILHTDGNDRCGWELRQCL